MNCHFEVLIFELFKYINAKYCTLFLTLKNMAFTNSLLFTHLRSVHASKVGFVPISICDASSTAVSMSINHSKFKLSHNRNIIYLPKVYVNSSWKGMQFSINYFSINWKLKQSKLIEFLIISIFALSTI